MLGFTPYSPRSDGDSDVPTDACYRVDGAILAAVDGHLPSTPVRRSVEDGGEVTWEWDDEEIKGGSHEVQSSYKGSPFNTMAMLQESLPFRLTRRHGAPVVKACRLSMEGAQIHSLSFVVLSLPRRPTRRHGAPAAKVGSLLDLGISPSLLTSTPSGMLFSLLPLSLDDSAAHWIGSLLPFSRVLSEALRMPQPAAFVSVQPSDGQPTPSNVSNKKMKHGGEALILDGVGEVAVTIGRNSQQPLSTTLHPVNLQVNMLPVTYPQSHNYQQDDFHKIVARTLSQGSTPMSMDFHPLQQTLLLVGTNVGDIGLWDVGTKDRLVVRNFKVWDLSKCIMILQASLVKDPAVSVNHIIWSLDGTLFGVAYSRHIVQIYSYNGGDDIRQHSEV
ncbi:uncharacterized protein [Zea mays]|nr:uncharacterized protein LOC111591311 [Zea mays]